MNALISYPEVFQIRKKCIISYTDPSYYIRKSKPETEEKKPINRTNTFSISAKQKMKKILDLWIYTNETLKPKYSFITLTISGKMDKNENHFKMLNQWIEKIQYRYTEINYVWKAEYQENGNVHYHLIMDDEIQWKTVRKQWNKTQSKYVDEYQNKMKLKYKNGYYFDSEMKNKDNTTVDAETQLKRYKKGYKANWRNPNSTDTKVIEETETVEKYINKYINKKEEENQTDDKVITRYWGCNDKLRELKYSTISELSLSPKILNELKTQTIKEIKENNTIKCTIINKIPEKILNEIEQIQLQKNIEIIKRVNPNNYKLIEKDNTNYNKLFEEN